MHIDRLMTLLRQKYPAPQNLPRDQFRHGYCVGGAICLAVLNSMSDDMSFSQPVVVEAAYPNWPSVLDLADTLLELNQNLDERHFHMGMPTAVDFAEALIVFNNGSQFDKAWETMRNALLYGREDDFEIPDELVKSLADDNTG